MQYGVYIDQAAITKAGLAGATDATDWLLIEYLRCWWKTGKGRSTRVDGKAYYWLNYRRTLDENPLLGFSKPTLSRRITKLTELEVLDVVVAPDKTLYARPGAKLEEVDRLRDERDAGVEKSESECGKPFQKCNTYCNSETAPVSDLKQHNQSTNQSEEERAAPRRATSSIQAPSHKQPRRDCIRDPIGEVHRVAVGGIRARVPDFVDHSPDVSRKAIRDRALAFGRDRVPKAPPNEQLAVGAQRVRELLAFLFASKRERLPLIRTLDESAWTVRAVVSANSMQTLAQHAGRKRPSSSKSMAEIAADFEARKAERAAREPNRIPPQILAEIRKRASTRGRARASPTTNRGARRLADTGTGPSVVFETVDRNRNGES